MPAEGWPPVSVAATLLPMIRRELLVHARAPRVLPGPPIDVCAILEDGLLGYELAPHGLKLPYLILGCSEDRVPRLRRTSFDPTNTGLRLATVRGRTPGSQLPRPRRSPRSAEVLYADWGTAAAQAWTALDPALAAPGTQWDVSMTACRALESALAVASRHLAPWDPAIDFCGLLHQAEYGLPLRGADGGAGTLTLRHRDLWHLQWRTGSAVIDLELTQVREPQGLESLRPEDVRRCE